MCIRDSLLRAWHKAQIDGILVIVTNAYHSTSDFARQMETYVTDSLKDDRGLAALGKVKILSSLSDADLEALYRRADLVALPTRGEVWGRPHVEAMASGTPIVATNWSGPTAYLDASVGFPLAWTGLEPVGEGPFASHEWAAPDAAHLAAIFAEAVADPARLKALGANARRRMVERYAPEVLAAEVQGHLKRIREAVEARAAGERGGAGPVSAEAADGGDAQREVGLGDEERAAGLPRRQALDQRRDLRVPAVGLVLRRAERGEPRTQGQPLEMPSTRGASGKTPKCGWGISGRVHNAHRRNEK